MRHRSDVNRSRWNRVATEVHGGMSTQSNKIIVVAFTTLDGVVEDPDGSWGAPFGGWAAVHGPQVFAGDRFQLAPVLETGSLLLGRSTWELFAQRWPSRTDAFAAVMNRARKHVVTRTLTSVDGWSNSDVLPLDLAAAVQRLRVDGDVVVVGSTSIVHHLAARDLVDQYRVLVLPTVLGVGERLFDGGRATLRLVAADVGDPGVLLTYDVVRDGPAGRLRAAVS